MAVRNWGESANGNWTLRLVDKRAGDLTSCIDLGGWSVTITVADAPATLDCKTFEMVQACANGGHGPLFSSWFDGIATGITDPIFTNKNGVSLVQACCVCGGGLSPTAVPDVLKSWRMAVYGRHS
jgi:hypothetical protein